jgi:hypothetical protein
MRFNPARSRARPRTIFRESVTNENLVFKSGTFPYLPMKNLFGTIVIILGMLGLYNVYQGYAAKEKERRNIYVDQIRRVVNASIKAAADTEDEQPWASAEGDVFRILASLKQAEDAKYGIVDTLKQACSGAATPGQGRLIAERMNANYAIAKELGAFSSLNNVLRMQDGNSPTLNAKGWEDEPLSVGHIISPVLAPEASRSLVNLVVMPQIARDTQTVEPQAFAFDHAKKWLSERVITPDSYTAVVKLLEERAKRLF